jgi:sec-independent protein translocase protein TatA
MFSTLALGMPMGAEWLVIAALGLLIFGKRLPEVGRSLGRGIVEFKKGIKGVEEEIAEQVDQEPERPRLTDQVTTAAPLKTEYKFDPYTGKPVEPAEKPKPKFDPYTGKPIEGTEEQTQSHGA